MDQKQTKKDKDLVLRQLYLDPSEPTAFGGARQLYLEAKQHIPSITFKETNNFLRKMTVYTRMYPPHYNFNRRPIVAFKRGYHQIDLAVMLGSKGLNRGYGYFLLVLDTLSGMLYAEPVRRKTAQATANAYKKILKQCDYPVKFVQSDEGKEFGGAFRQLLKSRNIRYYSTRNKATKAAGVERGIRTIKRRLYMYMTDKKLYKWINVLPKLIHALNNMSSSVIHMKPVDVSNKNEEEVFIRRYHDGQYPLQTKYSFDVDDLVRCLFINKIFHRAHHPSFSPLVYRVKKRFNTRPHTYKVASVDNNRTPLKRFYSTELISVGNAEPDFTTPPIRKLIRK